MRINAMVCRIIRQFFRDKRTLALLLIAPMLVLTLLSFVFNDNDAKLNIGVENKEIEEIIASMKDENDISIMTKSEAKLKIEKKELDAYISGNESNLNVLVNNHDNSVIAQINKNIQEAVGDYMSDKAENIKMEIEDLKTSPMIKLNEKLSNKIGNFQVVSPDINIENFYGNDDMSTIDYIGPLLIGLFIFFFVFLISGVSFLRERTTGTLERLLATPIKRYEIVFQYLVYIF